MSKISSLKKTFVFQGDKTNCGMACLMSISNYYRDKSCIKELTKLRAIGRKCETFAQLYDCAKRIGFEVTATTTSLNVLKTLKEPCILEVNIGNVAHYLVYYSTLSAENKYLIGDPAKGIVYMTASELAAIWTGKRVIQVQKVAQPHLKSPDHQTKSSGYIKWIKREIRISINQLVLSLSVTILSIAIALSSQQLVDKIIPGGNLYELVKGLAIISVALVLRTCLSYIRSNILNKEIQKSNDERIGHFLKKFIRLPLSFFNQSREKVFQNRINDIINIQTHLAYLKDRMPMDLGIVFSSILFFAWYSIPLALSTLLFISLFLGIATIINRTLLTRTRQVALMEAAGNSPSQYLDIIYGINTLKSTNNEDYFLSKIREIQRLEQNTSVGMTKSAQQISIFTDLLKMVFILITMTICCLLMANKELQIGEMIGIIFLMTSLAPAISRLSKLQPRLQEMSISIQQTDDFSMISEEYPDEEKEASQLIKLYQLNMDQVSFSYPDQDPILDEISLQIQRGEIIAILGKCNSGKSTLLSVLQKHIIADSGLITVNGQSLKHVSIPSWRNITSYVSQDVKLFHGSIIENIAMGQSQSDGLSVIKFCKSIGFDLFFNAFPQGYFTIAEDKDTYLSKGQKQLIAMARALYRNPQLLLLDEATSSMDPQMETVVLDLLRKLQRNMVIILTTQEIRTTRITENVFILREGSLHNPHQFKTFYS